MITHTSDGRHLYYETQGSGPDILFVHGAGRSNEGMMPTVELLALGFRCTSFDRLGWRRSAHLDRETTPEEQVQGIEDVRNAVTSEPVWLFGHSSGGNCALAYAVARPKRVRGLVLMEPALYAMYPTAETPPGVTQMAREAMPLFRQGAYGEAMAVFFSAVFGDTSNPQDRPPLSGVDLENWSAFTFDQPIVISWRPTDAELRALSAPVLIIEGDQSPELLRGICRRLHAAIPGSRLVTIEGHGHGAPSTAPERVAQEMEAFIAERGGFD